MEMDTQIVDVKNNSIINYIKIIEAAEIPEIPEGTVLLGKVYDFLPSGIEFSKPATISLGYDTGELPAGVTSVRLAYYTPESGWTYVDSEGSLDTMPGVITRQIDHFSIYAVLAESSPSSLGNLTIETTESRTWNKITFLKRTGKEATVSFTATNDSLTPTQDVLVLKLNGDVNQAEIVSLQPGETKEVVFAVKVDDTGEYTVSVGDLSDIFEHTLWINWPLILVIVAIVLIICILIIRKALKGLF
jgi:hypothetical protein